MKITIITATYNSSRFLEDCIQSVLNQTYPNIEYIIIDGKSKDNTLSIIKKYEDRISKWVSEDDRGMYDAINKGVKMATGEVIGLLNSDDMFASNDVVETIAKAFIDQKVDSTFGDLAYIDQMNTGKIIRFWKGNEYNRLRFMYGWMPAHPTFYVKKELITQFGDYQTHFYTAADYEFMSRLLFKHKISSFYVPKLLVKMRVGGQSNSTLKARLRANRRDFLAMRSTLR